MKTQHTRSFCSQCQAWTVICGGCGNNTCNGGGLCEECSDAHDIAEDQSRLMALPVQKGDRPIQRLSDRLPPIRRGFA